jgi:hypothetical protein
MGGSANTGWGVTGRPFEREVLCLVCAIHRVRLRFLAVHVGGGKPTVDACQLIEVVAGARRHDAEAVRLTRRGRAAGSAD